MYCCALVLVLFTLLGSGCGRDVLVCTGRDEHCVSVPFDETGATKPLYTLWLPFHDVDAVDLRVSLPYDMSTLFVSQACVVVEDTTDLVVLDGIVVDGQQCVNGATAVDMTLGRNVGSEPRRVKVDVYRHGVDDSSVAQLTVQMLVAPTALFGLDPDFEGLVINSGGIEVVAAKESVSATVPELNLDWLFLMRSATDELIVLDRSSTANTESLGAPFTVELTHFTARAVALVFTGHVLYQQVMISVHDGQFFVRVQLLDQPAALMQPQLWLSTTRSSLS